MNKTIQNKLIDIHLQYLRLFRKLYGRCAYMRIKNIDLKKHQQHQHE